MISIISSKKDVSKSALKSLLEIKTFQRKAAKIEKPGAEKILFSLCVFAPFAPLR
jgi:hypothetical protein